MEKFILPKHWCVRVTEENKSVLDAWRLKQPNLCSYDLDRWLLSDRYDGTYCNYSIKVPIGYTPITFDEFKQFVLKQLPPSYPIPEDWNIEVRSREQFEEVAAFLLKPEYKERKFWTSDDCGYGNVNSGDPMFIKPDEGSDIGFTYQIHRFFPIKKSITWEQFQLLKERKKALAFLPDNWCVKGCTSEAVYKLKALFTQLTGRIPEGETNIYFHYPEIVKGSLCTSEIKEPGYTEIRYEHLLSHFPKATNLNTNDKTNYTTVKESYQAIKRADLEKIHSIACSNWKTRLENKASNFPFAAYIPFSNQEIKEMFDAATPEQLVVVSQYFERPEKEDKNLFIKGSISITEMTNLSQKVFGNGNALQLLNGATPDSLYELRERAFVVPKDFQIVTGDANGWGTYIAIYKK